APGSRAARHRAQPSPAKTSRKFWPRRRRSRLAALGIVVVGVLGIGLATGFGAERSAEPTAQAFLYDWEQQEYSAAGSLTTAEPATVAASLRSVLGQLDTGQFFLSMNSVVQHGDRAEATFNATVDLADSERVWRYQGRFALQEVNGGWKVEWAPSVINPSLGPGERLAVVNQFPDRAPVLDAKGSPLQQSARAYVIGVWPQQLKNPSQTASDFAKVAKVQAGQVLGQITAAPPQQFLHLATLDADTYASLRASLRKVPGLVVHKTSERLYHSAANGLVGTVGSEIDPVLRADGAIYAPGTTVGLNGLEHTYQRQLLGTPTTEVVTVNSSGTQTGVLSRWTGTTGTPLRTTIDPGVQSAALSALNRSSNSGELVAASASTGQVLAVAQRQGPVSLPAAGPLASKLAPGTAFTIVSAAAVINQHIQLSAPVPCANSFNVGGQTFTSDNTGQQQSFSTDFAQGCSTAFAGLSERFSPSQFVQAAREFGIGSTWTLPVPAFSGSVPAAANDAALAAETVGQGNVRVSLLSMAMVAGTVDSGSWHVPQVVQTSPGAVAKLATPLPSATATALRSLMRGAVSSGAAKAARASGGQVYGQVGLVHTGSTWTSWFVGYQGDVAIAAVEYGKTARLSAASLARAFFSAASR
ncbi:MAG: penicillin-binding transpeptidase domain-containing protein, partial [Streptosporangiaceae bacterium]